MEKTQEEDLQGLNQAGPAAAVGVSRSLRQCKKAVAPAEEAEKWLFEIL